MATRMGVERLTRKTYEAKEDGKGKGEGPEKRG